MPMSTKEVKQFIELGAYLSPHFRWDEDNQMFTDDEVEYQIRSFGAGWHDEFRSILVRFTNNYTGIYQEFFAFEFENIYDLVACAVSSDTIDYLIDKERTALGIR